MSEVVRDGERRVAEHVALLFTLWIVTRLLLVTLTRARGWYSYQDDPFDLAVFPRWGHGFATGQGLVPLRDGPWEYPAGAALVFVLPALLVGVSYQLGFVALMLAADAGLLLVLVLAGLRAGRLDGAWLWVAAVPLLGPVALSRYDVIPTLTAVAGVALGTTAPIASGALLALGGSLKLWPLLLLPLTGLLLPHGRRAWAGAAAAGLAVLAVAAVYGYTGQLLSFLSYQRDRGLEVESLPALPLLLARLHGEGRAHVFFAFGSYQIDGPHLGLYQHASTVGLALVLAGTAVLAARARRRVGGRDVVVCVSAALLAGLLCVDKVLSAQYPLWLAGLVALGLCTRQQTLRPAVPLLGVLLLLTQLVYPLLIQDIVTGRTRGVVVLTVRDLVLLALTAQLAALAWRATAVPQQAPAPVVGEPVSVAD